MGIFFKDYESAGPGISKHAPKKKGIALFFDILFRKFWHLMWLNILFCIFFIPLIVIIVIAWVNNDTIQTIVTIAMLLTFMLTIGPGMAGLTKVMRMFIIEKHTFMTRDYFRGVRSNFKKASIIGFIDCLVAASAYAAFNVYPLMSEQYGTKLMYIPMIITFSLALIVMMMNHYIFLMLIATNLSLKNLIKNSFALAFVAMKNNILTFILNAASIVLMIVLLLYATPVFFLLLPVFPAAFICFVTCFNSYPVIQKYVINPYYTSIGQINPELISGSPNDEEPVFEDMGGKEKPIEKRKKGKGRTIS